jgi:tryptophan halogenase
MKKRIVIVGGGASGWLSALYVNDLYKDEADITLIESKDIGILGAGEGSVPVFTDFLDKLNIDLTEFLIEVNGTHKLGISFENWNGDGKKYMHDFFSGENIVNNVPREDYIGYLLKNKFDINQYSISKKMAYDNKSPLGNKKDMDSKIPFVTYSFHFDAHLMASYLRKIAEQRGVKRIEALVTGFTQSQFGDINSIELENGESVYSDFVFDCSGFKRLIVGKLYNTPWISYKNKLTVNSALTFQLPQTKTINPYTKAIAMKYGWMWQIPLQTRWGCGYIYDNKYINESQAKSEVEDLLGYEIKVNKLIEFDAGRYNSTWINNCIAIGLSAGFTEPLEATHILITQLSLQLISKFDIDYKNYSKIGNYNLVIADINDLVVDFLQYHYITKRTDSGFWNDCRNNARFSNRLKKVIETIQSNVEMDSQTANSIFGLQNWIMVGNGVGIISDDVLIEKYNKNKLKDDVDSYYQSHIYKIKNSYMNIVDESEYLNYIKNKKND